MTAAIPLVWSDAHRGHAPAGELWVGIATPAVELPVRAEAIRAALEAAGHPVVAATAHDDAALTAVHDPALLEFLAGAHAAWTEAGLPDDPGQPEVIPYFFPNPALLGTLAPAVPVATWARTGFFAFDTMTPVGPGTWAAARGGADATLTAVDLVADGAPAAYACCRPPGHHVTRAAYGGACYLNNAAIAAAALRERVGGPVAIADIDAHHGNGAQSIFYADPGVRTGSVHVDPAQGWFPHFLGFEHERGEGEGTARTATSRSPPAAATDRGSRPSRRSRSGRRGARALVVALGVDAAAGDPESPLRVTEDGYRAAGRALGALGLPTVVVQEGGYDPATIGALVAATLAGLAEAISNGGRRDERSGWGRTRPRGSRSRTARTSSRRRTGGSRRSPPPSGRARWRSDPTAPRGLDPGPRHLRRLDARPRRARDPRAAHDAAATRCPTGRTPTRSSPRTGRGSRTRSAATSGSSRSPAAPRASCWRPVHRVGRRRHARRLDRARRREPARRRARRRPVAAPPRHGPRRPRGLRRRVGRRRVAGQHRGRLRLHAARRPQPLRDPRRRRSTAARSARSPARRGCRTARPPGRPTAPRWRTSPSAPAGGRCTASAPTAAASGS